MSRDPAVLFYTSDFLTGCLDLDFEERGQYITLLCLQHQKGRLSEKTIRLSVGNVSDFVLKKFIQDDEGLYYNKRMEEEMRKRAEFTNSRRENGKKGGRPKKASDKASAKPSAKPRTNLPENENENENINENEVSNIPDFAEFLNHAKSKIENVKEESVRLKYDSWRENGWRDGNNLKIISWKAKLTSTVQYLEKESSAPSTFRNNRPNKPI